ncbi:MAG: hypothetical protein ACKOEZ_14005 [Spartobacteria bacterium]
MCEQTTFGKGKDENTMITSAVEDVLANLPVVDDVNAVWPKDVLLFVLGFPAGARNALCNHYWRDRSTVSLFEVFDLLISWGEDPRPGYIICPLLDFRNIGRKNVLAVLDQIGTLDLGLQCNASWNEKYAIYRSSHRMKGRHDYSWSFPISEQGKKLARYKTGGLHRPELRGQAQ